MTENVPVGIARWARASHRHKGMSIEWLPDDQLLAQWHRGEAKRDEGTIRNDSCLCRARVKIYEAVATQSIQPSLSLDKADKPADVKEHICESKAI